MIHAPTRFSGARKMNRATTAAAKAELESIIRASWAIYERTGDARDAELARSMEADARELLACLPAQRPKRKASGRAKKRKAFRRSVRLNPDASILTQVQDLVR